MYYTDSKSMILPRSFYIREDIVQISRELLGKVLYTSLDGGLTAGIITETEAYAGEIDRASHAYGGRRTLRTEVMYRVGGTAYVYLCYGVHSLFNIVTNMAGVPHAVLVRGIVPYEGKEMILYRTGKKRLVPGIGSGPGRVSKALGIHYSQTGTDLLGDQIWLEDKGIILKDKDIEITRRIGVEYSGEDALLPYRFVIKDPGPLRGRDLFDK
jgi:DNA-3-methyladenine glycosylase